MRDNLRRTNVVLTEELLEQIDGKKERYHGSRSQLIRQALVEYFDSLDGDSGSESEDRIRSLFREVKDLESEIGKIEEKVERGMGKREGRGSGVRKVSEDVESLLLEKGEPLSIPEIGEYLPHEQKQLLRGVERLEDQLRVERIERGDGLTKWRAGGSRSAE